MRVTEKGQVTIPKHIRDTTGIGAGSEVEFVVEGNSIVLRKVDTGPTRGWKVVDRLRGRGDVRMTTDEILTLTRGEPTA